jgi:hypothetical protein
MNTRAFNFTLMLFWLLLGVGLLTRDWWMSDELKEKLSSQNLPMIIGLTFLLAGWNFVRFWSIGARLSAPRESAETQQIRRKIRDTLGETPKVTDPQFDFGDPTPKDTKSKGS